MNKWLCKHFDSEKKGFVTISDVAEPTIKYGIYIAVGTYVIHSMYLIARYPEMTQTASYSEAVQVTVGTIGWIICLCVVVIVIIITGLIGIKYISEIKIAKCKIRAMENNDAEDVK